MKIWNKMTGIKYLSGLFLLLSLLACNDDIDKTFEMADGQFVRFFMLVDNGNNVLEYPQVSGGLVPVSSYDHDKFLQLKIPVALTATNLESPVTVDFSSEISNNLAGVNIEPANTLSFTNERLTDTIYVNFTQRWNDTPDASITFRLTDVSNPNIQIGMPNSILPNDVLAINFSDVNFIYNLDTNLKTIAGNLNETFDFKVLFPNGYLNADINQNDLLQQTNSFDYDLTLTSQTDTEFYFRFVLNEDLSLSNQDFAELIQLNQLTNYTLAQPTSLQIRKGIPTNLNVSGNFFDINNSFFRLFGERWRPNSSGDCEWRAFNTFTKPVPVIPNGPFDQNGDGYHDARIAFIGNFPPIGTNIFDMARIFDGESNASPGLTMEQALDLRPEEFSDGTFSTINGIVNVVPESVIFVRIVDDVSIEIPIEGNGTYELVDDFDTPNTDDDLWRMNFTITFDLTAINGDSNRTETYVLFNKNTFPEPVPLNQECFDSVSL